MVLVYQNCAPSTENTLQIPSARNTTTTTRWSTGALPCGPGLARPNPTATCVTVSDTEYAPGDDGIDTAIACPEGSTSAGSPKAAKSDCRPLVYFSSTPGVCTSAGATSVFPQTGAVIYGCLVGVADVRGQMPQLQACVTSKCSRPALNSLPPSDCQWVGFPRVSATEVNQQWNWDSAGNRFLTINSGLSSYINMGPLLEQVTGEFLPNGTMQACPDSRRPWITMYWQRPDGGATPPSSVCLGSCN